ncbi:alpha-L-fucosidase-like [Lytechinus pictus]|uniref:alpha-L-fucosidase-like n=1 Tax=Lytechinus pictus TaxID=7653 RepID=UPI0030B9CE27
MKLSILCASLLYLISTIPLSLCATRYQPNWDSIDSRPIPAWYDEAKFGIFMHWGVYSVPSFFSEWFWYRWKGDKPYSLVIDFMKKNYRPGFTYADFARDFTTEFFDPAQWADIIKASGAKYCVLTSKHHEGFTNWPSNSSWNWNSMDVGPKRDLVGELAAGIRNNTNVHFGLYYSLFEWFNPLFLKDKANGFTTTEYRDRVQSPDLYDLVNRYKPEVIWTDGSGTANSDYWKSTEFLAWLYNDSPVKDTVVVNDRWGDDCPCKHGGYYTCHDRYDPGVLQKHKFEDAMSVTKGGWGYAREKPLRSYLTAPELLVHLIRVVSCGGNLLLNIGPTHDGRIMPIFEERLRQIGSWLKVNGEGIYSSRPWRKQNDTVTPNVWYTTSPKNKAVYAFLLEWPVNNLVYLRDPVVTSTTTVSMLGHDAPLKWTVGNHGRGMNVTLPLLNPATMPCDWAWTLKLVGVE